MRGRQTEVHKSDFVNRGGKSKPGCPRTIRNLSQSLKVKTNLSPGNGAALAEPMGTAGSEV